ncbi:Abnormal spindle-like microcephaly-associated protein-like protein [Spironucleus salmonicida]|uniref:Abnormal spindle-like microcephaly-associated protein-like protein n=1 Tax=Spironucleus salmonicida TaxID=348837 RepID=V6LC35_9EUKA|nr:Abnormal spindle-like microcephaly-associated protein-like protein [Spironucleus salmonicida]|eukprot:EST41793.1 Abnormal spindle-like microcephaly-associated protein-like protein [Spironucleus salmonicida]
MKALSKPWFFGSPYIYYSDLQIETKQEIIQQMKQFGEAEDIIKITKSLLSFYSNFQDKQTDELVYKYISKAMLKLITHYQHCKQTQHVVLQFLHAAIIDLSRLSKKQPENAIFLFNHLTLFTTKCKIPLTKPLIQQLMIIKAQAFNYLKKPEPTLLTLEEAYQFDPKGLDEGLSLNINLAYAYQYAYRYKEALPHAKLALQAFTYLPNQFDFMFKGNKVPLCKVILSHLLGLIFCGLKTSNDSVFIWYNYFDECLQNSIKYFKSDENIFEQPIIAWAFRQLQLAEDLARRLFKDFKGYIENGKYKRLNDFMVQKYGDLNQIDKLKFKNLDDLADSTQVPKLKPHPPRSNSNKYYKKSAQNLLKTPFQNEMKVSSDDKLFRSGRTYQGGKLVPVARASTLVNQNFQVDQSPILQLKTQNFRSRSQLLQRHELEHLKRKSPDFSVSFDQKSALIICQFKYERLIQPFEDIINQSQKVPKHGNQHLSKLFKQLGQIDDFDISSQNLQFGTQLDQEKSAAIMLQGFYRNTKNLIKKQRKTRLQIIQYQILRIQQFARTLIYQQRYNNKLQKILILQVFFKRIFAQKLKAASFNAVLTIQKQYRGLTSRKILVHKICKILIIQIAFYTKIQKKMNQNKTMLVCKLQDLIRQRNTKKELVPLVESSIMIQKFYYMNSAIVRYKNSIKQLICIQKFINGYLRFSQFNMKKRAILKIGTLYKGFQARMNYSKLQNGALKICQFYKMNYQRNQYLDLKMSSIYIQRFYKDFKMLNVCQLGVKSAYIVKSAFQMQISNRKLNHEILAAQAIQNMIKTLLTFRNYKFMQKSSLIINKLARSLIERLQFERKPSQLKGSGRLILYTADYEKNSGKLYNDQRQTQIIKQNGEQKPIISLKLQQNKYLRRNTYFAPQITVSEDVCLSLVRQNNSFYEIVIDQTQRLLINRTIFPSYQPLKSDMVKKNSLMQVNTMHPAQQQQLYPYLSLNSAKASIYKQVQRPDYVMFKLKDTFKKGKIDTWSNIQRNNHYKYKEEKYLSRKSNQYNTVIPRFYSATNLLSKQITIQEANKIFDNLLSNDFFDNKISFQDIQNLRNQQAKQIFLQQEINIPEQKTIILNRLKQMPQKTLSLLTAELIQQSNISSIIQLQNLQLHITKENSILDSMSSQLKVLKHEESLNGLPLQLRQLERQKLIDQKDLLIKLLNKFQFAPTQFVKYIDQFVAFSETLKENNTSNALGKKLDSKPISRKFDQILPYNKEFIKYSQQHYISPKEIINLANCKVYPINLRTKFIQNKQATIMIQKIFRGSLAVQLAKTKKNHICKIQSLILKIIDQKQMVKYLDAVLLIQKSYRQLSSHFSIKDIHQVIQIQSKFRSMLVLQQFNANFPQIITIQRFMQGRLSTIKLQQMKNSSLILQQHYRNYFKDMIVLLKITKATTLIQKYVHNVEEIVIHYSKTQGTLQQQANKSQLETIPFSINSIENSLALSQAQEKSLILKTKQDYINSQKQVTFEQDINDSLSKKDRLQLSEITTTFRLETNHHEKQDLKLSRPLQILGRSVSASKNKLQSIDSRPISCSNSQHSNQKYDNQRTQHKFQENRSKFILQGTIQIETSNDNLVLEDIIKPTEKQITSENIDVIQQNTVNSYILLNQIQNIQSPTEQYKMMQLLQIFTVEIVSVDSYPILQTQPKQVVLKITIQFKFAAIKLQNFYRRRFIIGEYKIYQITKIQSFIRQFNVNKNNHLVNWAAWKLQYFIIANRQKKFIQKVIIIQSYFRQKSAQYYTQDIKLAALIIQQQYQLNLMNQPSILVRNAVQILKKHITQYFFDKNNIKQIRAALRIQTQYRKSLARREFISHFIAVVQIQAIFRGKSARKELDSISKLSKLIQRSIVPQIRIQNRANEIITIWNLACIVVQKNYRYFSMNQKFKKKTTVVSFISRNIKQFLVQRNLSYQERSCQVITCLYRGDQNLKNQKFEQIKVSCSIIQKYFKMINILRNNLQLQFSVKVIRKNWRRYIEKYKFQIEFSATIFIQMFVREFQSKNQFTHTKNSISIIQRNSSGFLVRHKQLQYQESIVLIQSIIKGFIERRNITRQVGLCYLIQSQFYRVYELTEESEDSNIELHTLWLSVEPQMRDNLYLQDLYRKKIQRQRVGQIRSRLKGE